MKKSKQRKRDGQAQQPVQPRSAKMGQLPYLIPRSHHLCAVPAPTPSSFTNLRRVAAPALSGRSTPLEWHTGWSCLQREWGNTLQK